VSLLHSLSTARVLARVGARPELGRDTAYSDAPDLAIFSAFDRSAPRPNFSHFSSWIPRRLEVVR
jgi:hypothetical protein